MKKVKKIINKLSKTQKMIFLVTIFTLIFLLSIGIPTFSRYKNRNISTTAILWDGSIASNYKIGDGTESNPYIISNGSELAYFYTQLSTTDYENKYFELGNDIVLNNGVLTYDETNGVQYTINNQTYYVKTYSNSYYDNIERTGNEIGTLNIFNSLNNFKGTFNGKYYRIYGLYVTNENSNQLGLFTNLQGTVKNLYVENSIIYGGTETGGIASNTNNATITDSLYNGYVIGKNTNLTQNINTNPTISAINMQTTEATNYIDLTNNIPFIGSEIISTSITGNYTINGVDASLATIKINGIVVSGGSFTIDLGTSVLNNIPVTTSVDSSDGAILTIYNLSYNITYNYGVSGGISAISNNTFIKNSINKGSIYGYSSSGGLVGVTTNLININQSYNTGNISSNYVSGGLIGTIEKSGNDITISKSYNDSILTASTIGGLVGMVSNNTGSLSITNSFEAHDTNYCIGTISNTSVNVTNSYFDGTTAINSGTITGSFTLTSLENLKAKDYTINNLSYSEFIDFDDLSLNGQNAWIYEENALPILFIDDIKNPIANIYAGTNFWNNVGYELSRVRFTSNITFSIEGADELRPIKEIYYYISTSETPLTNTQISQVSSWNNYTNIVQISEEGKYVIYAKVVDYNDHVTYLNTDLLVLDLPGSSATINFDNNNWSDLRSNLNYIYEDREKVATIEENDNISDISSIKYYITDEVLSNDELNNLDNGIWIDYNTSILVNNIGKNIIYVKLTDSFGYVNYINSDYIVLNGYTNTNLIIGRNTSSYPDTTNYINSKSTITLEFNYSNLDNDLEGYTHNLISNILLPTGTNITLIDNINSKVYNYKITNSDDIYGYASSCNLGDTNCQKIATYPFTLFNEIGSVDKHFIESSYYSNGTVTEKFIVVVDFSNTNISTDYNSVNLSLQLHDLSNLNVRPTLYSTLKGFNIISSNANAGLYLNTDYSGDAIIYNSDSSTNININSGIDYKYINDIKINDTTYEDKNIGLAIKLVDSNGNIVNDDYLKNIIFRIGDNEYYPEDDIVHINLGNAINDVSKTLTIVTNQNNSSLKTGTYYFKIYNYVSNDGYYYNELGNTEISIPVTVLNDNIEYGFNVLMEDQNRIVDKTNNSVTIPFNILEDGNLVNPNIRVSLYKKNQITAYNQDYSIVDLKSYVSDTLNECGTNVYYVSTNPTKYNGKASSYNYFQLNLLTANFENTGYKFVFELYDGNKKIGTIERHFIVK